MPERLKSSSRLKVLVLTALVVVLGLGTMIVMEETYLIPRIEEESRERLDIFPMLLAVSNQKAIITNDLAALNSMMEQIVLEMEGSGVRYVIFEDADGKMLVQSHTAAWGEGTWKTVLQRLRSAQKITVDTSDANAIADLSTLGEHEAAALGGGKTEVTAAEALPPGYLPAVARKSRLRFKVKREDILDVAVPIARRRVSFGGVRVGIVDRTTAMLTRIRVISYTAAVLLLIASGVAALLITGSIDMRFQEEVDALVTSMKREHQEQLKKLEAVYARKEEDHPITPTEFLGLLDFARKVTATLDYNEVLEVAIHSCLQVMNVRDASIFILDVATNELVGRIGHDENGFMDQEEMARIRVPVGKGDIGMVAEFGTTATIDTPRPGSALVSALVTQGRTIGVILVRNKLSGRPFIKKDQMLLRIFSGILANAMETAAIYHHLTAANQRA
ncbi:MAG: GAF domain-containing protein [Candidatus Hydrogenedentota bacterium]|nr:MAG: GAF domain-containing protein [Candidatus Hydrogenedentota bacterium]